MKAEPKRIRSILDWVTWPVELARLGTLLPLGSYCIASRCIEPQLVVGLGFAVIIIVVKPCTSSEGKWILGFLGSGETGLERGICPRTYGLSPRTQLSPGFLSPLVFVVLEQAL